MPHALKHGVKTGMTALLRQAVRTQSVRYFMPSPAAAGPIRLNSDMPCYKALKEEGVWVEKTHDSHDSHSRFGAPVRVCILNLMPLKEDTELQLSRLLGRTSAPVEITWCVPNNYDGKNSAPGYIDTFYRRFSEIKNKTFDGFIVTGAPIEHLEFEQVKYWPELQEFFEFIRKQDAGLLALCWGAMASIYHFHDVRKHATSRKEFGVFPHVVCDPTHTLAQALPGTVGIPVSRHTTWNLEEVEAACRKAPHLQLLLKSDLVGPGLLYDSALGHAHMINHFE